MRAVEMILRYGLAAYLIVAGGNVFFRFTDIPEPPKRAQEFLISLTASGYVWPSFAAVFIVSGVLLFFRDLVGLALVVLIPVTANILLYLLFLENSPWNGKWGVLLCLLHLAAAALNRDAFRSLVGK